MYPAKPLFTKVVMSVFTVILTSSALLGNGFVLAIIARFKSLRTFPNILVANLAVVDLFNAALNLPFHMIPSVLEASLFRGKTLAIIATIWHRLFAILNLASMLAMMVDVYLAISFEIRYRVWKTNKKALACAFLIWLFSIVAVMLSLIPLLDIDLGDAHVNVYRTEVFQRAKYFVASFMAFFIICNIVVYFLTTSAIKKKKEKVF
ncbi:octopamine receptor 2-like [Oculina patagonica]